MGEAKRRTALYTAENLPVYPALPCGLRAVHKAIWEWYCVRSRRRRFGVLPLLCLAWPACYYYKRAREPGEHAATTTTNSLPCYAAPCLVRTALIRLYLLLYPAAHRFPLSTVALCCVYSVYFCELVCVCKRTLG